jgi:uncharacterized membrane protein
VSSFRLEQLERRVQVLEGELRDLRAIFAPEVVAPEPSIPSPVAAPPRVGRDEPAVRPAPPPPRRPLEPLPAPEPPRRLLPELSFSDLLGAKTLAITGGIVTLLGIVFFFILAVNRGWIGPVGRVAMGAAAAGALYGAGLWLRRRYGLTHSSLAAVAAGLAGGYAVLLAATSLYHFVDKPAALVLAAGIAALAVVTALRWNSEIVAGIGLLGATLAPPAIAIQGGLSVVGTWFVAVMLVGGAAVAAWRRWHTLLVVESVAGLLQVLALVLRPEYRGQSPAEVVALAAVFAAIAIGTGIAVQLRDRTPALGGLVTSYLFAGAAFAVLSVVRLFGTSESRGVALLVVAGALGLMAAACSRRERERDLSALLAAIGLIVGGIAFGELLSGSPLAYAWAGEAAVLAWLARRVRDIRYQLWALVYLVAALLHVLLVDVPASHLFEDVETSADAALAVVAVGAAAAAIGAFAARRRIVLEPRAGLFGRIAPIFEQLGACQRPLRTGAYRLAALASVYALSLGVLAAVPSFDWGHMAMYGLWAAVGLSILAAGLLRGSQQFRYAGVAALGITVVVAFVHGERSLAPDARAATFLVIGAAVLAAAMLDQLVTRRRSLGPVAFGFVLAGLGLGLAAVLAALDATDQGFGFLGLALAYGVLAATVFAIRGERDFATLLWSTSLVLAHGASERLLPGTFHVLTLALAAVTLGWMASRLREPRFLIAAAVSLVVGVATVLFRLAPPTHLFHAQAHPGNGSLAALLVAGAAACVAALAGRRAGRARVVGWWVAGVLAVYGLSLLVLELFQLAFPDSSVQTDFQRGHTAVSAFWGLVGLAALYFGLTRVRGLRVAGFALFAVSLVKIFVYDLPSLSSVTRALSFLAVGAVLLLGGFFFQRLASRQPAPPARTGGRGRPRFTVTPELVVAAVAAAALIVWFGTS